ncbi:MAG TPA: hypothetical protein VL463_06135 [Kofleriaceae bacterium]|nr:hypothetical protein [Kofleriaceae bacterium]
MIAAVLGGAAATASAAPSHSTVVYVNRGGGTVSAGDDDSHRGTSSLVESGSVKIPAWKGGEAKWKKVMSCVRDRFSAFDLEIVEERPQHGDYIEAMVGGQPSLLGYGKDVSGIAPYTGEVMPNAIVYIFAAGVDYDVEISCVDVLHEVGHALGLDHEYLCADPMSYLWDCDQVKTFQDVDASCGEDDPRACESGAKTQNSYAVLARNVGLRSQAQPAPEPPAPADEEPDPSPIDLPDQSDGALGVSIDGPSGTVDGDRAVTLVVHGRGDKVSDAALAWLTPDGRYTLDCASMPAGSGASCKRKGDDFVFRLEVGTGWRYFAAVVVDSDGKSATSDPASAYFQ